MGYDSVDPGPVFSTKEQAQNWVSDLASAVQEARARCDLEQDSLLQKQWHHKLLVRYGAAKGALDALYRCGMIETNFYSACCAQTLLALAVKVSG
jgi:hypothetical protein